MDNEEYFKSWSREDLMVLIKDQQTIIQCAHKALMFSVMANAVTAFDITADPACMGDESLENLMGTLKSMAQDCPLTHPSFQALNEWMDGEILRTQGLPDELNARLDEDAANDPEYDPGTVH